MSLEIARQACPEPPEVAKGEAVGLLHGLMDNLGLIIVSIANLNYKAEKPKRMRGVANEVPNEVPNEIPE